MGAKEQELHEIVNGGKFDVPNFSAMRDTLEVMRASINALLTNSSNWKGATATAGKATLERMAATYKDVAQLTVDVEQVVTEANGAIDRAMDKLEQLPGSAVPSEVLNAVGTEVEFLGIKYPIAGAAGIIANLLADKREQVAADALDDLDLAMKYHAKQLVVVQQDRLDDYAEDHGGPTILPPEPQTDPTGGDPGPRPTSTTPSGPGSISALSPWTPTPVVPVIPTTRTPSVDDPMNPHNPSTDPVRPPVTGYPKPVTGHPIGSGLVPGIGGAAGAAGLAAAARAGGVGGGGLGSAAGGAGARLGSASGLTGTTGAGAGKGAAGGTGSASGSGAGGAGGRGSNVMGGGGGAGGAQEKDKRSGLGGLIAPKLEDDEDLGPRSAAADAGGRD